MFMIIFNILLTVGSSVLLFIAGSVFWKNKNKFQCHNQAQDYIELKEAPSVSVCIPVRNEHQAIEGCLEKVLANNYPKLEVIVLDDESVDNTPEIVKIFARSGVRFIKGGPLPPGWLGRNNALNQLAQQATGDYIIFMSVDTNLKPQTISHLISIMLDRNLKMLSVMPQRNDNPRASVFFGTLRYFKNILLHSVSNPATASAIYVINKDYLSSIDNLSHCKMSLKPEQCLAKTLTTSNQYAYLLSNKFLGISYEKRWHSQVETSVRLIKTKLATSDKLANQLFNLGLLLYLGNIILFIYSLIVARFDIVFISSACILILYHLLYTLYAKLYWSKYFYLAFLLAPFNIIQELILVIIGTVKKKSKKVIWKDRSVSLN